MNLLFIRLLDFIVSSGLNSPHVEFHLLWIHHIFHSHGRYLKEHATKFMSTFRALQKYLVNSYHELAALYGALFSIHESSVCVSYS